MYVKIPNDINDYEEKIFKGLSSKQIIFFIIAVCTGFLIFALLGLVLKLPGEIVSFIIMFSVIPIFLIGFFRKDGIPMDKWALYALQFILYSKRCLYDTQLGGVKVVRKKRKNKKQQEISERDG